MVPTRCDNLFNSFPAETISDRNVNISKVYKLSDKDLLAMLATVFLKSKNSQYRPVELLSRSRCYITLTQDKWFWGTLKIEKLEECGISLKLSSVSAEIKEVTVLRQFKGGADGQVYLALTDNFELMVVKKFFDQTVCPKEENLWKVLYNAKVRALKLRGSQCLVMPFVFHCVFIDGTWTFKFNMSLWAKHTHFQIDDEVLNKWTQKFENYITTHPTTPTEALQNAVKTVADCGYIHNDLEWRHVALLPLLDEDGGSVIGMKPVLIDLASVTESKTPVEAATAMNNAVQLLLQDM